MKDSFLLRCWKGDTNLPRVFWLYGVLPSLPMIALIAWGLGSGRIGDGMLVLLILMLLVYSAWILVSVWRCAERRGMDDLLAIAARWLTVAWAFNIVLLAAFLILGLLHDPDA